MNETIGFGVDESRTKLPSKTSVTRIASTPAQLAIYATVSQLVNRRQVAARKVNEAWLPVSQLIRRLYNSRK